MVVYGGVTRCMLVVVLAWHVGWYGALPLLVVVLALLLLVLVVL